MATLHFEVKSGATVHIHPPHEPNQGEAVSKAEFKRLQNAAHNYTREQIRSGKLPKANTQQCMGRMDGCTITADEWHHPDYREPAFVIPLCTACHKKAHKLMDNPVRVL